MVVKNCLGIRHDPFEIGEIRCFCVHYYSTIRNTNVKRELQLEKDAYINTKKALTPWKTSVLLTPLFVIEYKNLECGKMISPNRSRG